MRHFSAEGLVTRRDWLRRAGGGMGLLSLAALLADEGLLVNPARRPASRPAIDPMAPRSPHFPAKAKSVIWMFINGGPSHVDTWEYKPGLEKYDGKEARRIR